MSPLVRVYRKTRAELVSAHNRVRDRQLGIMTRDPPLQIVAHNSTRSNPNFGTSYRALDIIAAKLDLKQSDTFFDIGCGYGRVVCHFSRFGIRRCVGIELSPELARIARENAARVKGRACPIEIRQGDAVEADYRAATILYLYNPFPGEVMKEVLARVRSDRAGEPLRIVYANPTEQAVLAETPWLTLEDSLKVPYRGQFMDVSLWRSVPSAS